MTACVIMHTMIIEDDHGKNKDHTHYKLMGVPVQVRRTAHRVARFITLYYSISFNETHDEFQKDLMEKMVEMEWTIIVPTSY
jgi:hypothetical protein